MKKLFNLQLFAASDYTQTTGDAGMSAEMKTFYDTQLLRDAQPNLVFYDAGKKQKLPKNHGKTIEWRKFSDLAIATTALTEGVTPEGHKFTVTAITSTLYQYGDYTITTDVLELTTIDPYIVEATTKHSQNAAKTIDTITRNVVMAGTNVLYAPKSNGTAVVARSGLDATCTLTPTLCAKAATVLRQNDAPTVNGDYLAIVHPSVEFDLITNSAWIGVHQYTDEVEKVYAGEIGRLYNIRFMRSTNAKIWKGGASDPSGLAVYGVPVFGKDAYSVVDLEGGGLEMIIKPTSSGGTENALNQRGSIGWKVTGYAAAVLYQNYLTRIECCSAFSATDSAN